MNNSDWLTTDSKTSLCNVVLDSFSLKEVNSPLSAFAPRGFRRTVRSLLLLVREEVVLEVAVVDSSSGSTIHQQRRRRIKTKTIWRRGMNKLKMITYANFSSTDRKIPPSIDPTRRCRYRHRQWSHEASRHHSASNEINSKVNWNSQKQWDKYRNE
jgi:hypothetical protein